MLFLSVKILNHFTMCTQLHSKANICVPETSFPIFDEIVVTSRYFCTAVAGASLLPANSIRATRDSKLSMLAWKIRIDTATKLSFCTCMLRIWCTPRTLTLEFIDCRKSHEWAGPGLVKGLLSSSPRMNTSKFVSV